MSTDVDPSGGACDRANLARASRVSGGGSVTGPRFDAAVVPPDEGDHLADGVGALLAAARHRAGLTRPALAVAAGCSSTMVDNLERGQRRPRRSLLAALAAVLAPLDDGAALTRDLVAAAGDSLRPDTAASLRRRARAVEAARRARQRQAGDTGATTRRTLPTPRQFKRMSPEQAHAALERYLGASAHTPETHAR